MMKNLYQTLFLCCSLFFVGTHTVKGQDLQTDSLALVDLYNNCGGASWSGYDTWLNGPISMWEGVTVDADMQRVTHVAFKGMDLTGTLPASLGNMNEMSGKIEFHDDAGMTGELPAAIWKWTKVERFQLKRSGITSIDLTGIENMVNLTEYNTEKNAISGEAPSAIFALPAMEKVYLHDCNYDAVPAGLTAAAGKLSRLYFNGNGLTELPDLSAMTWKSGAKVRFHNNALTFEDLEPIVRFADDENVAELRYSPQATVGAETYTYPAAGSAVNLDAGVGGSANIYTWIKGIDEVVGDASTLTIDAFDAAKNSGKYFAVVQSELVPGLDIHVAPQKLFASAIAQDSLALVSLYNNNGGANWSGYDTWLNGPMSDWEYVTMDEAGERVVHVSFKQMDLTGTLTEDIGDLTMMGGKIEFHDDANLVGELTPAIWKWTNVERFQLKRTGITSINLTGIENMVNLTEYNTEKNAISGEAPAAIFALPAMEKVYLHDCNYDAVPAGLTAAAGKLSRLYFNGNNLTELPDLSTMAWKSGAKVRFHNNALTFEDLEPIVRFADDENVAELRYSPQATVGAETYTYPAAGSAVSLDAGVGGSANIYTWIKGIDEVVGEASTLTIDAFDAAKNSGKYFAVVQSELVPGLDIHVAPQKLFASATAQDSLALVALMMHNNGGYSNWSTDPINAWEGVTMNEAGDRVTHVAFKNMNLTGTLVDDLGDLTEMGGKIEFHDDKGMTGELPAVIWKWVNVERFQLKRSGITSIDLTGIENMVNLTEYNTEKNAISGEAPGAIFALPAMEKVYLHDCNYDAVPAGLTAAAGKLSRLYFNGNGLTELPDLSAMTWKSGAKVRFHNNALDFGDLEPIVRFASDENVAELRYSPQAAVGVETYHYPEAGSAVALDGTVGGSANVYTWVRGVDEVVGEAGMLTIDAFDAATNSGRYFAVVQSELVPGLDIHVAPQKLFASVQAQDSLALVDLYTANSGPWEGFETWLNGPISTWEGVTVDSASQRVSHVSFKNIPMSALNQSLEDITEMGGKIEIHDDPELTGELPAFLWRWTNVERFQLKRTGISSINTSGMENMVNLTEYNTEKNPITGGIPGVVFTLPAMEKVYLHDCEYDAVPAEVLTKTGMTRLYLNGNNLTSLPDMTSMTWGDGAKVRVHENHLTFEDLEGNVVVSTAAGVEEFRYSPQANVGEATDVEAVAGDAITMELPVGGSANVYTWVKGEDEVVGDMATYTIGAVAAADAGKYRLLVQNDLVPGLDIWSEPFQLFVDGVTSTFDLNHFGEIRVMGNPMTHTLSIQTDKQIDRVMIHSMNGQQFRNQAVNNLQINLPVSDLTAGMYLVTLQAEGQFYTLKMVKE